MPEEITQRLGFDASRAIEELRKLQEQLNKFKQGLQAVSVALRKFPSKATPAIKALRELANAANQATAAVAGLAQAGAIPDSVPDSAQKTANSMGAMGQQTAAASKKVQTAVTQSFNEATRATNALGTASKKSAATVAQSSAATAKASGKAAKALEETGEAGKKAATGITVSWKTVIRVVQAQVIVRALSKLISTFFEAHDAALELSIAIGEVATISSSALGSLDNISDSVLKLSTNLGIAAGEVAEGLYQTLSNQVVEAADALRFEEEAAKLSIATHSQLRESVNALSSVMNSYGLDVSEITDVSDALFTTIELGRLRMGEFGDVLGRVTPLTAALGIRYEEMAAAIAALTQKGVPAHTAITQLTQVSQKLLRPTKALQELYEEWGVETGPEAIRRFGGLQGVLLKMKDATAGNDKEFSDLLGRVRAMVGALNLTSNESNALTEALDAMAERSGIAAAAFERMEETAGRKAVKAWNELKNEIIKFGKAVLELSAPVANFLTFLTHNLDLVIIGVTGLGAAALILSGKMAIATASMVGLQLSVKTLAASLWSLWPVAVAVGVAVAGAFAVRAITDSMRANEQLFTEHKKQLEDLTKVHEGNSKRRIETTRKEFEERRKITGQGFSELTKEYRKVMQVINIESVVIGKTLNNTLTNLLDHRKKIISQIEKAVLGMDDAIKESADEVAATQQSISDDAFKRSQKHMTASQQHWANIERATNAAAKASRAYAEAGADEEKIKAAREESHLAEKRAQEAVAHAESMGNYAALEQAEKALDKVRANRIKAEVSFQLLREDHRTKAHQKELTRLSEAEERLKELQELMTELADIQISEGVVKSAEQQAADAKRIIELMPQLKRAIEEAFDFSMFEQLGGTEGMNEIKAGLLDAFQSAQFDWTNLRTQLEETISSKVYTAGVKLHITNEHLIEAFVKKFGDIDPLGDPGKFGAQMEQVLETTVSKYENLQATYTKKSAQAITQIKQGLDSLRPDNFYSPVDDLKNYKAELDTFRGEAERIGKSIQKSLAAGEPISDQIEKDIRSLVRWGESLSALGKLNAKNQDSAVAALLAFTKGLKDNKAAQEAQNEQIAIGAGAYEEALKTLAEHRVKQKEVNENQKAIANEAAKTEDKLKGATQEQATLSVKAVEGKNAIEQETHQARILKEELQGAVTAQKELTQAATVGEKGEIGEVGEMGPPEQTEKDLAAQAAAASKLNDKLVTVDNQFNTIALSMEGVTQAMIDTAGIAAQIAGSLTSATTAVGDMQFNFGAIVEHMGASIDSMGLLTLSINDAATAIESASLSTGNWTIQLNNCASAGYSVASAMQAAASAALKAAAACASATAACAGGRASAAYYGGPSSRYYQEGGFSPRGEDRIPIMAAPGEFIVSARNARLFASELQAMNTGRAPNYRDHGGPITNIGDINVSVTQGETASQTARAIATALNRELRRGTSRLG